MGLRPPFSCSRPLGPLDEEEEASPLKSHPHYRAFLFHSPTIRRRRPRDASALSHPSFPRGRPPSPFHHECRRRLPKCLRMGFAISRIAHRLSRETLTIDPSAIGLADFRFGSASPPSPVRQGSCLRGSPPAALDTCETILCSRKTLFSNVLKIASRSQRSLAKTGNLATRISKMQSAQREASGNARARNDRRHPLRDERFLSFFVTVRFFMRETCNLVALVPVYK